MGFKFLLKSLIIFSQDPCGIIWIMMCLPPWCKILLVVFPVVEVPNLACSIQILQLSHVMVECSKQSMYLYWCHFMIWNWLVCQSFACGIIIMFCNNAIFLSNLFKRGVLGSNCTGDFKPSFYKAGSWQAALEYSHKSQYATPRPKYRMWEAVLKLLSLQPWLYIPQVSLSLSNRQKTWRNCNLGGLFPLLQGQRIIC